MVKEHTAELPMATILKMEIAKRKRAEEALRESEEILGTIFRLVPFGICVRNANGDYLRVNDEYCRIFEIKKEEPIESNFSLVLPPDEAETEKETYARLPGENLAKPRESKRRRKDGAIVHIESADTVLHHKNGQAAVITVVRDITEGKLAEASSKASEEKYRELVQNANSIILRRDTSGKVTFFNEFAQRFFGYSEDEILGRDIVGTIVPEVESTGRDLRAMIEDIGKNPDRYINNINENMLRSGERVWVAWTNKPILDDRGQVVEVLCIGNDCTEHKRSEEALKDSEQLLKNIIHGYPIPAFMIGKDHRIIHWNRALEESTGIGASAAIGTSKHWRAFYREERPCMADLLVNEDKEAIVRWYGEGTGDSEVLDETYEAKQFFPDLGETGKWLHSTAAALRNSRGAIVGAITTIEDITDREKAEEILRASENRYRAIFENTGSAALILEEDTTISLVNVEFEKLTGYTKDEIENKKSWTEFVVKEDLARMLDLHCLRRADANAALKQYEFRLIDRHGQTRDCLLTIDMIADTKRSIGSFLDVTERWRAQEALISANRQLNDIIEFLPDATFVVDKDKKIIAWNRAIEEMTGVSKEEMTGKGELEWTVPFYGEKRPHLLDLLDACDKETESRYQHVTKKGGILRAGAYVPCVYGGQGAYVFCTAAPLFDAHGNRAGAIESIRDITEQRLAQEALRRSEEKYRELVENANSIILRMDNLGNVTFINEFALRFFGYSEEGILGKNVAGTIVPRVESTTGGDPRSMFEDMAVNPDRYASSISENMRRGGERVWIAWTSKPILDENGRVVEVLCVGNDITELKWAQDELKRSEERFKILFECAPDPYYLCDLQGSFVDGNRAAEEAAGYKREEMIGKNLFEANLLLPEDIPRARKLWARNRLGYPSGPEEFVLNQKEGKRAFLELRTFPTVIREQNLILCIARDITKRKQAEEELRESRQRLSDIIDFLPDATFVIDREGKVIAWNRAIEEMTGIMAADMLGKGNYEYALTFYRERRPILIDLVLESRQEIEQKYEALENTDRAVAGEAYMPALRDGEAYLFGKASALFDSRGNVVGAIESIRDVTERRRAEAALIRAEEKYRDIFENSVTGIYQVTMEGLFLSLNKTFARIVGYDSPQELLNTVSDVWQLYVHRESRFELLRLIQEQGSALEFEVEFFRKDRSVVWVVLNVRSVRTLTGEISYLEGTASDITDRKLLRAQLNQAQKMQAIGTLAGGIAHDFNNILQPMMGYTEMALNELCPSDPVRRGLEQVFNASLRAKELVKQILTISRSSQEQERIPIDISSIIKEALKLLRSTLPTSIQIKQSIEMGVAQADATQIHQVLMNLCTNAAHAMDGEGVMEVRMSPVDLSESDLADQSIVDLKPGPYLELCVSDTGCGMDARTMERIFDPYFTTKQVGKGNGLGLAIVNGIIKRHEGAVSVATAPGKGTTFSIYIPRVETAAEIPAETPHEAPAGTESILLLDDDRAVVEMGTSLLERHGYKVTAETDSLRAIEVFSAAPDDFDLLITDYTMPNLTGMDLVKAVRRIRPDMPVMLCTGFSEKITPDTVKELGIELLMKPYGLRQISEAVRKILDARRAHAI